MKKALLILALGYWLGLLAGAEELNVSLSPARISQGSCFAVRVSAEGSAGLKVRWLGAEVKGFDGRAIVGVPITLKPGAYPLELTSLGPDGQTANKTLTVKVSRHKFPSVSFWLKPAKKKLLARDLINDEWALIDRVLRVEGAEQCWTGRFSLPAKAPFSMLFGTIEKVNGRRRGDHKGLDIAVPAGTRILAPNNGTVVFAQKLKAFGGTIVIDHGQGIHTLYFHLSKFLAEVGQTIARGDPIALSGNSGISSGPHLHWGMSVHNLRVDPLQWTKTAF